MSLFQQRPMSSGTPTPGNIPPHRTMAGPFAEGSPLTNGIPISLYLAIPDAGAWRIRALFTASGTLSFQYTRPSPNVYDVYTDVLPDPVLVTADVPVTATLFPQGECYVIIVFTPDEDGEVGYLDTMHAAAPIPYRSTEGRMEVINYLWDPNTLSYVVAQTSDGTGADVNVTNTVTVTGPLTNAQLRATPVPVTTGVTALVPASPTAVVVGAASDVVVAANAARTGLKLRNLSTGGQRISLAYGVAAVLDEGDTLYAKDVYSMNEFDFTTDDVRAIASGAGAVLAIQELS